MSLNIGDKIPEFELFNYDKTKHSDKDFLGQKTMFVFMPFPFSSVCDKEICELRDYQESFLKEDTNTILITVGASPTNRSWAAHHNIEFPILSDINLIPTASEIEDPISWAARTSLPPI